MINSNSTYDSYHGPLADVTAAYGLAFNANPVDYAAVYPADDTYVFPHIRYGYETINSKNLTHLFKVGTWSGVVLPLQTGWNIFRIYLLY